jgi:hypothetical protein
MHCGCILLQLSTSASRARAGGSAQGLHDGDAEPACCDLELRPLQSHGGGDARDETRLGGHMGLLHTPAWWDPAFAADAGTELLVLRALCPKVSCRAELLLAV